LLACLREGAVGHQSLAVADANRRRRRRRLEGRPGDVVAALADALAELAVFLEEDGAAWVARLGCLGLVAVDQQHVLHRSPPCLIVERDPPGSTARSEQAPYHP